MAAALVTGAGRGLGAAIATRLAADGWAVGLLDRDAEAIHSVASALGDRGLILPADILDESAVDAALDRLEQWAGPVAAVVCNAGIVRFGPLLDIAQSDFRAVTEVNLVGTFTVGRAAARRMVSARTGGAIVNITSMNGVAPGPNGGAYGPTKAGVALLTQQMALEWGAHGIRVNAVAPGVVDAGMNAPILSDPAFREARRSKIPLGRLGTAEDISAAVAWLLSPESSYVSGQNLLVDGGVTMSVIAGLPRPASVDGVGIR